MQEALANLNNSWQGLSQREKIMVATVSVLLIGYLLFSFYFTPQQLALDLVKQQLTQTQGLVQDAKNRGLEDVSKLLEQIKSMEAQNRQMEMLVPASKNTPDLLVQLYDLSLKDKVVLGEGTGSGGTMELGEVKQHETYADYDVHMILTDKGENIYKFVYDVARLDRMVSLNKVLITPEVGRKLKCDLTLRVYILGQTKPDPDPDSYPFVSERLVSPAPYDVFKPVTESSDGGPATSGTSSAGGAAQSQAGQTGWNFHPPSVGKNPGVPANAPFLQPPSAPVQ